MRFSISQGLAGRRPVPHVPKAGVVHGHAQVAQLVEQRTENPRVGGSNPPLGTIFLLKNNHLFARYNFVVSVGSPLKHWLEWPKMARVAWGCAGGRDMNAT